ncbi:MAG TPA: type II toxin-antitoxin system HicA family toxin [bacterium]|nr:MAG: YcfA-like protein [bacterium ADurb.Bin236]HOY63248.1 type II toxin-antitoxin system HicA family toxin [bacterium]HPI76290.1 type II toxin-antitoxin system HicA family toxin [bacterium]HPN93694.1 type II toxin-antitoxin system HicA family toxin [bacterium]
MTKIPDITGKKAIRAFQKNGWNIKSQKGSHAKLEKPGVNHFLIVPVHATTIPKGTLSSIIKDAGLTIEEFIDLL